jgi:hypothetical protein
MSGSGNDPLQVLAAAVTPVVLVSATAILISGVNARYIAISDRMRTLTHEFRDPASTAERRAVIRREMVTFERRVRLVSRAVKSLYTAVGCFISDALLISATSWRQMLIGATLPLFLFGIALVMTAVICQILELQLSNRTLMIETEDVRGTRQSP